MVTMRNSEKVTVDVSEDGHTVKVETAEHGVVLVIDQVKQVVVYDRHNMIPAPELVVRAPLRQKTTNAPERETDGTEH